MRISSGFGLSAILLLSACDVPPTPILQPEPAFVAPSVAKPKPATARRLPVPVVERTGGEIHATVGTVRGAQEDRLGDLVVRGRVAGRAGMIRLATGLAAALAFGGAGGRPRWVG